MCLLIDELLYLTGNKPFNFKEKSDVILINHKLVKLNLTLEIYLISVVSSSLKKDEIILFKGVTYDDIEKLQFDFNFSKNKTTFNGFSGLNFNTSKFKFIE